MTEFKTDIEIALEAKALPIMEVAEKAGLPAEYTEQYGKGKLKVNLDFIKDRERRAKLILVTAITPTPAGEGKTTTTIGLADGLQKIGKKVAVALREPSLGPVFGMKGGAAGGGYSQVIPMEDINLHFTGDIHAVTAANNLLAAMIDNHIYQGNELNIDQRTISWKRCMDMNDRQLRNVVDGLGGKGNGVPREDSFDITVASEVMAVLCLANGAQDLKARLGRMVIGYDMDGKTVTASQLKAEGALAALLRDALKPNMVQTLEHTPAFIHGGPFANIAHGCNSVMATTTAMSLADYTVTEAGFGADLGAEKFLDIKCRTSGLRPSCAVIVATVRALKMHGGVKKTELGAENLDALVKGLPNLLRHVDNMSNVFGLPTVVSLNRFPKDTEAELDLVIKACADKGIKAILFEGWAKGGDGATELAEEVVRLCAKPSELKFAYDTDLTIKQKLDAIVRNVYRGEGAEFSPEAKRQAKKLTEAGFGNLPVCIAKTQYSFSDNAALICAPEGFTLNVRTLRVSAGAGFIVAICGDIQTMPGLPAKPAAEQIDLDKDGRITGLF